MSNGRQIVKGRVELKCRENVIFAQMINMHKSKWNSYLKVANKVY
jgi:hypothetical protein